MLLRYPRFIHSEFMTHRMFSRNSSSSRAVPTAKLLEEVRSDDFAVPIFWGKNKAGMQAAEELASIPRDGNAWSDKQSAQFYWRVAADHAASSAELLSAVGAHKQIVNRILEPFLHINTLVSATEWDNFFGLRLHKDAQPEMQALARAMWEARQGSVPVHLEHGQWHLPFIDDAARAGCRAAADHYHSGLSGARARTEATEHSLLRSVSVARCARLSYMSNVTDKRSMVEEDLALYDRLVGAQPMHASPAEHQATPDGTQYPLTQDTEYCHPDCPASTRWRLEVAKWQHPDEHGNYRGWRQLRRMLPGQECSPLPEGYP